MSVESGKVFEPTNDRQVGYCACCFVIQKADQHGKAIDDLGKHVGFSAGSAVTHRWHERAPATSFLQCLLVTSWLNTSLERLRI